MPAVCRIGHADVPHCSGMTRAAGSVNVNVNGIALSRQTDINTSHLLPGNPCPGHTAPIAVGSATVLDAITSCTSVAEGSLNVFAGG